MICLILAHLERELHAWLPSQAAGLKQHAVLKVPVHILTLVGELLLQSSLNYTSSVQWLQSSLEHLKKALNTVFVVSDSCEHQRILLLRRWEDQDYHETHLLIKNCSEPIGLT